MIGIKEYGGFNWNNILEEVIDFIKKYQRVPITDLKILMKQSLEFGLINKIQNYKKQQNIMKNENIYDRWASFINQYTQYFNNNEQEWYNMLSNVEKIMNKWIIHQQYNYKRKQQIMINKNIYDKWTNFINLYTQYFKGNEQKWNMALSNVGISLSKIKNCH